MILYPAIDLKDGNAVRLLRGDMDKSTVFNTDPAAQAREFVDAGCEWLHLVDLNGAFEGEPVNAAPVEAILRDCKVPAQLGGGIRNMKTIETWITKGLATRDFGHRCSGKPRPCAPSRTRISGPCGRGH
jgi:phosphoribosylformimino-5-aminoimidazole carboxamide ribotide isomerase